MRTGTRPFPAGWRREPLSQHIESFCSGIARGEKSRNAGFMHLRMNNITDHGTVDLSSVWRIPASERETAACALQPGDVLFNNTNSRALVGKSCVFDGVEGSEPVLFSNHITRIRTKTSLSPRYLAFWINVLWQKGYFTDKCDVWVNQAAIRVEEQLFPLLIPMPPTPHDQAAIAAELEDRLGKVESMRRAAERQHEAAHALRVSVIEQMFSRLENAKPVPLKHLIDLAIDGPHVTPTYVAEGVPFVTVLNICRRRLDFAGAKFITPADHANFSRRGKAEFGDILITKDGTLGTPCLVDTAQEFSFFVSVALIKPKRDRILPRYLFYALDSRVVRDRIAERSMGAGLKHLVLQEIKALEIPFIEDKGQQQEVASRLQRKIEGIDKLVCASERQLEAVQAMAGAILRETFDFSEN